MICFRRRKGYSYSFFFQAEDGIRDLTVTGVQTCALPISMGTFYYFATDLSRYEEGNTEFGGILKRLVFNGTVATSELVGAPNPIVRQRSEERRVGKECRSRWSPYH